MSLVAPLLALVALLAAGPKSGAPPSEEETWIHCGALLDVPGEAPRGASTLILAGAFVKEVREGLLAPPKGATAIDLSTAFVMPGLIDCHTHVSRELGPDGRPEPPEASGADATARAVVYARRTLEAGFTTIRDLGSSGDAVFQLRDAIHEGSVAGPRILAAGMPLSPPGGPTAPVHGYGKDAPTGPEPVLGTAEGPDACRKAVLLQVERGADVIKLMMTGGLLSATADGAGSPFSDDELEAIASTAHRLGRRVAAHAHGADGIKAALRAGVDSIEHGSFLDEEAVELFLESGAYLVPTLLAGATLVKSAEDPKNFPPAARAKARSVGPAMIGALGMAYRAGVKIAFGTDSSVSRHGENWREFPLMVRAGVPPMECLVAATLRAAELCDLGEELGTLQPGYRADVIALRQNPLEDMERMADVLFVMRDGEILVPR